MVRREHSFKNGEKGLIPFQPQNSKLLKSISGVFLFISFNIELDLEKPSKSYIQTNIQT